jgi:hypothetical protein
MNKLSRKTTYGNPSTFNSKYIRNSTVAAIFWPPKALGTISRSTSPFL